jgi:hypothetical protein
MTKEQFADSIHGREYPFQLTKDERKIAAEHGFVVIYGASDDLAEFEGVINDEFGAPGDFYLHDGKLLADIEYGEGEDDVLIKHGVFDVVKERFKQAVRIDVKQGTCWTVETTAPHAKFRIMEDGVVFCEGIVLGLREP